MSDEIKPQSFQAVKFLQEWSKLTGYPTLTAIYVDAAGVRGKIETQTFPPVNGEVDWQVVYKWINERNGKANLYFLVNKACEPKNNKASKTDMAAVIALHVDVDVRVGEDQEAGIARIKEAFAKYKIKPSYVVSSGGGAQAFWILDKAIVLDGTKEAADEAALYNIQVERDLGGDHCHNIDRIMRLPGTINLPNEVKIKKGRKPALATGEGGYQRHALEQFTNASTEAPAAPAPDVPPAFKPSGKYNKRAADDPALAKLKPKWIELGTTGKGIAENYGGDRSRACLAFVIECRRANVPDAVIADCLMTWKIGEHVRDQNDVARALRRVIERGRDFAHDPELARMNEKHHVVIHGGKTRVLTWDDDVIYPGREVPIYQTKNDFIDFHSNETRTYVKRNKDGTTETVEVPLGVWWWNNKRRAQYAGIVYVPKINSEIVGGKLNLWKGFTVTPRKGNCLLYLRHLRDNVCKGNREHYRYFIGWLAYAVQHPERRAEVGIVLIGKKGIGKTFAVDEFGALYGPHYLTVLNPDHFTGKFNAHLQYCSVLLADECLYAGDKKHEQIAKGLVTSGTIFIEPKGINGYPVKNYLHVFLCTNSKWAVPATDDERRWFVLNVGDAHQKDFEYFEAIKSQMDNGGRAALLYMLQNVDLSNFEIRNVPNTDALVEQQALSRHGTDALVETWCNEGCLPFSHVSKPDIIITTGQAKSWGFDHYIHTQAASDLRYMGPTKLKNELRARWGTSAFYGRIDGRLCSGIRVPTLAELRRKFTARFGPQNWYSDAKEWGGYDDPIPF
jgi:hypothetical protein